MGSGVAESGRRRGLAREEGCKMNVGEIQIENKNKEYAVFIYLGGSMGDLGGSGGAPGLRGP